MKTIKTITVIALAFLFGSMTTITSVEAYTGSTETKTTTAEQEEVPLEYLERALLYGLESDYSDIVESTLRNAIEFKTVYPALNSIRLNEKLVETINYGSSHVIRYKAYLTLMYYRNFEEFNTDQLTSLVSEGTDANSLFLMIDETVRESQLTAR